MYGVKVLRTEDKQSFDLIDAVDQLPVRDIPLNSLGHGIFLRGTRTDKAHVQMLTEVASFSELPPILVQRNSLKVIDGTHLPSPRPPGRSCFRAGSACSTGGAPFSRQRGRR